jgi:Ca2+-binding EF-hand superfamily protein
MRTEDAGMRTEDAGMRTALESKMRDSRTTRRAGTALIAGIALLLVVAFPAAAEEPESPREKMLETYDADGDGKISGEERQKRADDRKQAADARYIKLHDSDGDGVVDAKEKATLEAARQARNQASLEKRLERYDLDGDGEVSWEERIKPGEERRLKGSDANADGVVSRSEQAARFKQRKAEHAAKLKRYDADRDGRLDPDERKAANAGMGAGTGRRE